MAWRDAPADPDRPGAPVKSSLEYLVRKLGMPSTDALSAIFRKWPEIVGSDLAEHSRPIALRDGVLRVTVSDSQRLTQLKWAGPKVVERLNAVSKDGTVQRLELRLD